MADIQKYNYQLIEIPISWPISILNLKNLNYCWYLKVFEARAQLVIVNTLIVNLNNMERNKKERRDLKHIGRGWVES